jgi:hypothetical protein
MTSAQLQKIAVALGVLLVIWLGLRVVRGGGRDAATTFERSAMDRAAVDTIVLARATDTIRLTKSGAGWQVNGFAASATAVNELLAAVSDTAAPTELIAQNPSSHERLGVDAKEAKRLEVKTGATTAIAYLVGKRGANWESAYLRRPEDDAVYQVRGRLVEFLERRVDDWRDKRIVQAEPDSLTGLEIGIGRASYVLAKRDSAWVLNDGAATDSGRVASLLGQYRNLDASAFASAAQADSVDFAKPDRRVRILGPRGATIAVLAFDSTSGGFWVRRDSLPTIYKIDSWVADQLTPSDSSLRKR